MNEAIRARFTERVIFAPGVTGGRNFIKQERVHQRNRQVGLDTHPKRIDVVNISLNVTGIFFSRQKIEISFAENRGTNVRDVNWLQFIYLAGPEYFSKP